MPAKVCYILMSLANSWVWQTSGFYASYLTYDIVMYKHCQQSQEHCPACLLKIFKQPLARHNFSQI